MDPLMISAGRRARAMGLDRLAYFTRPDAGESVALWLARRISFSLGWSMEEVRAVRDGDPLPANY